MQQIIYSGEMEICRACLCNTENLVPFDDSFINGYNLLTNLSIKALDGISQYACETCISTVIYFLNFRDKCIASEGTLKLKLLETIKSEPDDICETEISENYLIETAAKTAETHLARRRGRPRKTANINITSKSNNKGTSKQCVGRPRKLANKLSIERVKKDSLPKFAPKSEYECSRNINSTITLNKKSIADPIFDDDEDDASLSTKSLNNLCDGGSKGYVIVPRAMNARPVENRSDIPDQKNATTTEEKLKYCLNIKHESYVVDIKYEGTDDNDVFNNFGTNSAEIVVDLNKSNSINKKNLSDVKPKGLNAAINVNEDETDEKEILFPCGLCKKNFGNQDSLSKHLEGHKTDTRCEICSKLFVEWQTLLAHRMQHVPKIYHNCHICHSPQPTLHNFENHYLKEHSEETTIPCGLCKKRLTNQESLSTHLESHKGNSTCKVCSEIFSEWQPLFAHRIMHLAKMHHKCHICLKPQRSLYNFEYHYLTQHSDKNIQDVKISCKICLNTYSTPLKLKKHIKRMHVKSKAQFICDVCSKTFTSKSYLRRHMVMHKDGKPHICETCGFSTKLASNLRTHIIRKHSETKVLCIKCTRAFESKEKLDAHKCLNPRYEEAICPVCGIVTNNLKRHKETHSSVRRHQCPQCPATYRSRTGLAAHVNRHTDARPLACPYCPMRFNSHPVLSKHKRVHTGEKPYVCKKCGRGFTGNHNLKVHMKIHGEYLIVKRGAPKIKNEQQFI